MTEPPEWGGVEWAVKCTGSKKQACEKLWLNYLFYMIPEDKDFAELVQGRLEKAGDDTLLMKF